MLRYLRSAVRGLTWPLRAARRRPLIAFLLTDLVLILAALGTLWYARQQLDAARADLEQDRPAEARSRLTFCRFVWPWDIDVYLLEARAARLSGDLPGAESLLKRSLKFHNGATQAVQLEFLLLRIQTGEVDEVAPTLIDSVEKGHPESPVILATLAGAYMHRLRYKAAYACLTRWIELRPDAVRPHQWRGWVLERMNHSKAAAKDYDRALELDPDLFPVRLRVAEMMLEDKRVPDALPHLERLHRQAPNHPEVQARLGMCRFFQSQPEEARRLMEAAVVHMPNDPALLIYLARLDLQEGRADEAEQRLRKVLRTDHSDTEALFTLVSVLQFKGRAEEASATLNSYNQYKKQVERANKMLQEVADSPSASAADYAEMGDLLLKIGRERVGLYWLEQALEREPAQQAAHKALAGHFEKKGDRDRAATHRRWLTGADLKSEPDPKSQTKPKAERRAPNPPPFSTYFARKISPLPRLSACGRRLSLAGRYDA